MSNRRAQSVIDAQGDNSPAVSISNAPTDDGGAHSPVEIQTRFSPAIHPVAHRVPDDRDVPSRGLDGGDDGAPWEDATRSHDSPVVTAIVGNYRTYARWAKAQQKLHLQCLAICRAWTDGDKKAANALFTAITKGKDSKPDLALQLAPYLLAMAEFEKRLKPVKKNLQKLARETPYWPWIKAVRGFGDFNLAKVIGAAGAIEAYRNPSCLWKRMGLAVIDGERQRRVANDPELAIRHGYDAQRRAIVFLIGECLLKAKGPYRAVYDERRAHTAITHPEWPPIHSHKDGLRFMTKRVLRDLWVYSTNGGAPEAVAIPSRSSPAVGGALSNKGVLQ